MSDQTVSQDVVVSLLYRLTLDDGSLVEESTADDPLVYLHGHDNIIPGLENALNGMVVGEQKQVSVEAVDAYGEYEPDEVDEVPVSELPDGLEPEVGMVLAVHDEDGEEDVAQITGIEDDVIILDFNHPLAGQRLHFDVTIAELREATAEELEHGHVHDDDYEDDEDYEDED
ncbi:MAG: peptidylprolyl isomerase [Anaerolineae bacterium]|nr:peptidylprolyl isomerase [Anaerolineae bacterium]